MQNFLRCFIATIFLTSLNSFANQRHLTCELSSFSVPIFITVDAAISKVSFAFTGTTEGAYSADAQFTPTTIHWVKIGTTKQVEQYKLDRQTLNIERKLFLYGNPSPSTQGSGSCQLQTPSTTKI